MINFFKYIYIKVIAVLCNFSPAILEWVRYSNIKGKAEAVKYLKLEKDNFTIDCSGINYNLNLNDELQQHIYMNNYEKTNIEYVLNLMHEGDIFFDAGANVGAYTLPAANRLKTGANIYSFEPDPDNFKRLNKNCSLNVFSKDVNRYELALTNFAGTASFYRSDAAHSGWHSLTEFKDISQNKINVNTSTLDSIIKSKNIKKIDVIKIDVEANEFELLEGSARSLKDKIFRNIYIEFNGSRLAQRNKTINGLLALLKQYNYYPFGINLDLLKKLTDGEISQHGICENFLFVPGTNGNNNT